jgi:DNA-binding response OmpR family regulator
MSRNPVPGTSRIVIVEPDEAIRQLLHRWLEDAKYMVCSDPSTPNEQLPDLLILDAPRPEHVRDGLHSHGLDPSTPVLIVSARFRRGLGSSTATAQRLGARRILPKPFTREEFLAAVAASLDP